MLHYPCIVHRLCAGKVSVHIGIIYFCRWERKVAHRLVCKPLLPHEERLELIDYLFCMTASNGQSDNSVSLQTAHIIANGTFVYFVRTQTFQNQIISSSILFSLRWFYPHQNVADHRRRWPYLDIILFRRDSWKFEWDWWRRSFELVFHQRIGSPLRCLPSPYLDDDWYMLFSTVCGCESMRLWIFGEPVFFL